MQLNTRPTLPTESGELSARRASTAVGRRASVYNPDRDTGACKLREEILTVLIKKRERHQVTQTLHPTTYSVKCH